VKFFKKLEHLLAAVKQAFFTFRLEMLFLMGHQTANKSMTRRAKTLCKSALLALIAIFSLHCHSYVKSRLIPAHGFIFSTPLKAIEPLVMHPKIENNGILGSPDKETSNESAEDSCYGESELIHSFFYE
jgi:hypothetical protein